MPPRLDAHAHFFRPGYVGGLPGNCRRVEPDEVTLYAALAARHTIEGVLAVGYEGAPWAKGNNAYLAELARSRPWLWPLAFIAAPAALTTGTLEELAAQGFVGISLYLFDGLDAQLAQVENEVWRWLVDHAWLISVNAKDNAWTAWQPILERHEALHLLPAHLGLPPAHPTPPSAVEAATALAPLAALAAYSGVHIKLSGFYALADPAYDYPHAAAWPYVDLLAEAFGVDRLLWGSDFSPALEFVSFDQTVAVIDRLPGFSEDDKRAIWGDNLRRLLAPHSAKKNAA